LIKNSQEKEEPISNQKEDFETALHGKDKSK